METIVLSRRPCLVNDVVAIVVDHFSQNSNSKDLASLALVSSAWVLPVCRALYLSVQLSSYHSCCLLSRTLAENSPIGDRIRTLNLHPLARACDSGIDCNCRSVNVFALSLSPLFRLQKLEEVSLGADCAIRAEQYLRSFAFPRTIRRLRVEGMAWYWSFKTNNPVNASLRWTEGLASRFTNLKDLELINVELRICEVRAFKPRFPNLERLYMDRVHIRNGRLSDLANKSWNNLEELTLIVSEFRREYDVWNIIDQARDSLRMLKYLVKETDRQGDLDVTIGTENLASCTSLRDLELSVSFGHADLKSLGSRLDRLESFKVYGNYEIDVEDWAAEISKGVFPRLKELHLPVGHELRRIADWQWPAIRVGTIRRTCEARGISLTYAYLTDYSYWI